MSRNGMSRPIRKTIKIRLCKNKNLLQECQSRANQTKLGGQTRPQPRLAKKIVLILYYLFISLRVYNIIDYIWSDL